MPEQTSSSFMLHRYLYYIVCYSKTVVSYLRVANRYSMAIIAMKKAVPKA